MKQTEKKIFKQHFKMNICCHIVTGAVTFFFFPFASYRLVGYWWKNDRWYIIIFSSSVWGKHYLLIHSIAASQFEENKHCGSWRQHHFYFMTAPRQLFPDWGKLSAAWHLVRGSSLLALFHLREQYCVKNIYVVSKKVCCEHWKQSFCLIIFFVEAQIHK